ncbi:MAG: AI-2E family transporter [Eubacteriales bacterium]|nr:AI-2E family transporter [Eubacteriales bacterium]
MELNRDNIRKLRGLIVFAVAAVVAGVNYRQIFSAAAVFLGMLTPFLTGGAIAFGLNVPMRFAERHIRMKRHERARRPLSLVLALIAVAGVLTVVMVVVIPELFKTVMTLEESIPRFFAGVQIKLESLFADYPEIETYIGSIAVDWEQLVRQLLEFLGHGAGTVLSTTVSAAVGLVNGVANFSIGLVFAIYILLQKEKLAGQCRNLLRAFLPDKPASELVRIARLTERTFSSFLTGQCVEAVILGSMFFVTLSVLRMPYALLIGVLIAFTALIPIFGAFIGCAAGVFLILMASPVQALMFIAVFLILQQIEGNLIYPHVVGGSVGLPSIWVLVAVTLGGSMMGILGMLIFIPMASVLYALLREVVRSRLNKKSLTENGQNYTENAREN